MQIQSEQTHKDIAKQIEASSYISLKCLPFLSTAPAPIIALHYSAPYLHVSRSNHSQLYYANEKEGKVEPIASLSPAKHFLRIQELLILINDFELQIYDGETWKSHTFTTQLQSIRKSSSNLYTFHQKESILWQFSPDGDVIIKHLQLIQTPFHLSESGRIQGYGKFITTGFLGKGVAYTVAQVDQQKRFIFAGDSKGSLHVFSHKMLTHLQSFAYHCAPILSIHLSSNNNNLYYSGSDSKLVHLTLINQDWHQASFYRGQSHDILSIESVGEEWIVAGGLSTDIGWYRLNQRGQIQQQVKHSIAYTNDKTVTAQGTYIVVNKRVGFQIWEMAALPHKVQLLVKYDLPQGKQIVSCFLSDAKNNQVLLVLTDEDTVAWHFSVQNGLTKYLTVSNAYLWASFLPGKNIFIGVRRDGGVQKVYCKTGRIEELGRSIVGILTDSKLLSNNLLLLGSKISNKVQILDLKNSASLLEHRLQSQYTYLDTFHESNSLLIKYVADKWLYRIDFANGVKQERIVELPVRSVRFGGWISRSIQNQKEVRVKSGKYWWGVSEGKIVIISHLAKLNECNSLKKPKIRVKQGPRIAEVFTVSTGRAYRCSLALIPYEFEKIIQEMQVKPVFPKKII